MSSRSLDWSVEDPAPYNEAFVGHAKLIPRCKQCLNEHHSTETCSLMAQFISPWGVSASPQFSPLQLQTVTPFQPIQGSSPPQQEVCRKHNGDQCFMRRCRYLHICSICGYPHPAVFCPRAGNRQGRERERPPTCLGRGMTKF